nr:MAG TPA: PAP Myotubularin-associated protein [Caudoviricetes sp.]
MVIRLWLRCFMRWKIRFVMDDKPMEKNRHW